MARPVRLFHTTFILRRSTTYFHTYTPVKRCISISSKAQNSKLKQYQDLKIRIPAHKFLSNQDYSTSTNEVNDQIQEDVPDDKLYRAIDVYLKSSDDALLDSYCTFAETTANELDIKFNIIKPKVIYDRYTVLRSVHIYKKHRVQYEIRTFKRVLQLKHITGCTSDVFLSYLQINIPAGVAMHVHKWEVQELPKAILEDMKQKQTILSKEDKRITEELKSRKPFSRSTTHKDYEEGQTTRPHLLGKVL